MKKVFLSAAISFLLIFSGNAIASELSADVITKSAGHVSTGKFYVKAKKVRMNMPQQEAYTIVRNDLKKTWMVQIRQKSYMEMPLTSSEQMPEEKAKGEISRKQVGSETIDGHPAKKYEITYKDGERTNKMYQWLATDIKFPVKQAAIDGSWSIEYKNIKMASQPDNLFEIPAGYQKMSIPAMPQGFNPDNYQQRKSKKRMTNE